MTDINGACKGEDTALFFSDDFNDICEAKRICLGCPVREECLDLAIQNGEQYGIWGGHRFTNGMIVVSKGRSGRPKKGKPRDMYPEVPLTVLAEGRVRG